MNALKKIKSNWKVIAGIISIAGASLGGEHLVDHMDKLTECMMIIKNAVSKGDLEIEYSDSQAATGSAKNDETMPFRNSK